ncbi:MAG TPA: hypothetical protein VLK33_01945, partial [Terriglobales bacterium]|nr:hypothetical protein [Terriglobales bacterium]
HCYREVSPAHFTTENTENGITNLNPTPLAVFLNLLLGTHTSSLGTFFSATTAAADPFRKNGENNRECRHTVANFARSAWQRIAPVFSPFLRQLGGASRASRRLFTHKSRHSVALLLSPAV